eukprot:CAMPEP_0116156872 /NCGR_PEP_ID=MMETSP0329-20121206/23053_1 /TAXON_ID=697910 /ORGANISM="Pseudo-nitzschia arenysensis, Strain B593" /LENGTH=633 /DNA_ID=CAMNT_0003653963 /DNA_START=46 /DNA_END=1947 /DNA_ORIENTATION=-
MPPKPSTPGGNGGSKPKSPSSAKSELAVRMEGVLQLLNERLDGQISTTQVESAVSDLLDTIGARKNPATSETPKDESSKNGEAKKAAASLSNNQPKQSSSIQEDEGNYDDSSDDDDEKPKKKKARIAKDDEKESKIPNIPAGFADMNEYDDAISQIPIGKEAAKMMTTFGDGPHPLPDPLELALMGTRKAIQCSIMDARKVRRRLQKEYREAQSLMAKYNATKAKKSDKSNPTVAAAAAWASEQQQQKTATKNNASSPTMAPSESNGDSDGDSGNESEKNETTETPSKKEEARATANSLDPRLVYRALAEGTDKLAYAHKCGFHMEELTHLYPEEMRAYQRWNDMHEEYSESKADEGNMNEGGNDDNKNKNGDASNSNKTNDNIEDEPNGGHLRERAANFDYRTDKMKNDWYVEYAKVRQGSFLPSSRRVRRTKVEVEWDRLRKLKKGRHAAGEWENISGRAVRFLHWLGFDPPNLYPPDEETTQALAFLAYDILGRIVEKAIFLRNEHDKKAQSLWELPSGEQLTVDDIKRALDDPDVKPATVYGTDDAKASSSIQLYFGPGWEDRLELEMEEMIASLKGSNHQISEEEKMVRNHEMDLLEKISAPPGRDGDQLEVLVNKHKQNHQQNLKET